MEDTRVIRESTGLRVICVLTNMLMLIGSAAALGIFIGASKASLISVCLFMTAVALVADQIQHRVRSFRVYTGVCLLIVVMTVVVGLNAMPKVWIPLTALSFAEVWSLYEGRIAHRSAFIPQPFSLLMPAIIWMVGTFGEIPVLCTLAFGIETALVLLFLSWQNQVSMARTYMAASERSRVPYRKIRHLNTGLLAIYLAAALILCVGLTGVYSGNEAVLMILQAGMMAFGWIIGFVISLFMMLASWISGGQPGSPSEVRPFDFEAAEALFPWLHQFWLIVDGATIVIGLVFLAYMIYLGLYSFYYNFLASDPETGDTRKRVNAKERRRKQPKSADGLPFLAGIGPAIGIRRAYISLIRMHPGGTELPESYTPSQIEYAVAGDEAMEEEWREIHELYEKARFAPRQVNRSDLKRMKELVERRGDEARRRREMKKRRLM